MNVSHLAKKLSVASEKAFTNPYADIQWVESLSADALCFSPELSTLNGTQLLEGLSDEQRRACYFWECVNFFSLNIFGERALIAGMSSRLYKDYSPEVSEYLHHFIDEENKHSAIFGRFCQRYAGKVYNEKKIAFPQKYEEGEEEFLFFAKIVIFEEFVDYFNVSMAKDERLHPLVQQINAYHHSDESRHLAFGRKITEQLYRQHSPKWSAEKINLLETYLVNYLHATWREYYNPDMYKDAGFDNGYDIYDMAYNSPSAIALREKVSASCLAFFYKAEIIKNPVAL